MRTAEVLLALEALTPFLRHGGVMRIEMRDSKRHITLKAIGRRIAPGKGGET